MTTGVARIVKTEIGGGTIDVSVLTAFGSNRVYGETVDIDFGQPDKMKDLHGAVFDITQRGSIDNINVYVGWRQRHEDSLTWSPAHSLAQGDTQIWFKMNSTRRLPRARYFRIRVEDTLPLAVWKLSKIELYGKIYDAQSGVGPRGRW